MDKGPGERKILILAACPKDTPRLRLDEEMREIEEALRRSNQRDRFGLFVRFAVTPKDLLHALLDVSPQIVHFSGHGAPNGGLVFENSSGKSQLIKPKALSELFEAFAEEIEFVMLNACYSEQQAQGIVSHIDYVVGMEHEVADAAAIAFSGGFYSALGAGRPVEQAYRITCSAMRILGVREADRPILKVNPKRSRLSEQPTRQWVLVLDATIDELNKERVEAILDRLRQLANDPTIVLREITPGSVQLRIESSADGFEVIHYLVENLTLPNIEGIKILRLDLDGAAAPLIDAHAEHRLDDILKTARKTVISMKGLAGILEQYLASVGYLQPVNLGPDEPEIAIAQEDNDQLSEMLRRQVRSNNRYALMVVSAFCILATIGMALVGAFPATRLVPTAIVCGISLACLLILPWLRRLWSENAAMEICVRILEELAPERGAELVNLLYWGFVKRKKGAR
jgi:hypothetical protein